MIWLKLRRLIAAYIDCLIIFYVSCVPLYYIYTLFENLFMNIFTSLLALLIMINLLLRKDCFIGYESIGKKICRLKIYHNDNPIKDKKLLMDRVFYTLWPFVSYPFMVLYNNKSNGDIKCNTEIKSFRKNC